jgi:hypothetical protein
VKLPLARPARGAAAGIVACVLLVACGDEGGDDSAASTSTSPSPSSEVADGAGSSGSTASTTAGSSADCEAIGIHIQMAMWNPTLADEMLALGCPWPYAAELQGLAGGAEDPSIDEPFDGRPYTELFEVLDAELFGICQVAAVPQDPATGLVFGFDVGAQPDGCREGATVNLHVMEWATQAHRDAAANAAPNGALVLGRWTVTVDGTDLDAAQRLATAVIALGATPVAA